MTTKIMIFAGHGCPVDAVLVAVATGKELSRQQIDADTVGTIFIHSEAALFLHERLPGEQGAAAYDDAASLAADLADAKARSEVTGEPIPDPLIDPVVTIDPSTNQIVPAVPDPTPAPAVEQGDASAPEGAEPDVDDGAAAQKSIEEQAAADAARAAQEAADAQAAAEKQAAEAATAAGESHGHDAADDAGSAEVDNSVSNSDPVASTDPATAAVTTAPDAGTPVAEPVPTFGTDPVDEEDPAKVITE